MKGRRKQIPDGEARITRWREPMEGRRERIGGRREAMEGRREPVNGWREAMKGRRETMRIGSAALILRQTGFRCIHCVFNRF